MFSSATSLPPTSPDLAIPDTRPYFLWWTDMTVRDLCRLLVSEDVEERAYWMGALLREANTRDVWLFVQPSDVRAVDLVERGIAGVAGFATGDGPIVRGRCARG